MKEIKKPELLAPAGTFEKMQYALAYGADAVYAGLPRFSLRARENDFQEEKVAAAIDYAHAQGRKFYLTMNIYPHNRKVASFELALEKVAQLQPDGLIMADPGMIMVARERFPELNIHLSTQANTINWRTVQFWHRLGVKRIILSRELSIDEIREMRQRVPDIELEVFVHGAICIAYSGRCLLSNYFNHRDANQGTCTNACRWQYTLYSEPESYETELDRYQPLKGTYFIEESDRPGELMPIDEDEHGTYIMNAKDLSTIHILNDLIEAGVDSLKIEGRTKSHYYVSVITRAYRQAIDAFVEQGGITKELAREVYAVANRGYVTGFLERNPGENGQNYEQGHSSNQSRMFAGLVDAWEEKKRLARIRVRNRFETGDALELVTPEETILFTVEKILDSEGREIPAAHGGGQDVFLPLPAAPPRFSLLRKVIQNGV